MTGVRHGLCDQFSVGESNGGIGYEEPLASIMVSVLILSGAAPLGGAAAWFCAVSTWSIRWASMLPPD